MSGLTAAAIVAAAMITYDEVHNFNRMPCPARYLWPIALFTALALTLGRIAPGFAAVVAWALVISAILVTLSPQNVQNTSLGQAVLGAANRATKRPKTETHTGGTTA